MKRYGGGEKSGTIKKLEGHGVLGIGRGGLQSSGGMKLITIRHFVRSPLVTSIFYDTA